MCWIFINHEFYLIMFLPKKKKKKFTTPVAGWHHIKIPFREDTMFSISRKTMERENTQTQLSYPAIQKQMGVEQKIFNLDRPSYK